MVTIRPENKKALQGGGRSCAWYNRLHNIHCFLEFLPQKEVFSHRAPPPPHTHRMEVSWRKETRLLSILMEAEHRPMSRNIHARVPLLRSKAVHHGLCYNQLAAIRQVFVARQTSVTGDQHIDSDAH